MQESIWEVVQQLIGPGKVVEPTNGHVIVRPPQQEGERVEGVSVSPLQLACSCLRILGIPSWDQGVVPIVRGCATFQ